MLGALGLVPLFWGCASASPGHDSHAQEKEEAPPPKQPFDPSIAAEIGDMFQSIQDARYPNGAKPMKRAVFLKDHGCAHAEFTVLENKGRFHQGLFADQGVHEAWVRISSDTVPMTSDLNNNTIGFAVKVLGVTGRKVLPGELDATTQDFLTQNIDVFFVDTAKDFRDFTKAALSGGFDDYVKVHTRTGDILKEMAKVVPNILGSNFWSTTPYKFGDQDFAKYKVVSCSKVPNDPPPAASEKNYLRTRLERDILATGACFELQVQLREGDMPLDAQTVEWSEDVSKPVTVATISVAPQDITKNRQLCEDMEFTAWHSLEEHRPVGSVNEARGIIYKRLSDARRMRNGIAIAEPVSTENKKEPSGNAGGNDGNGGRDGSRRGDGDGTGVFSADAGAGDASRVHANAETGESE
jgi:hypothetical protein